MIVLAGVPVLALVLGVLLLATGRSALLPGGAAFSLRARGIARLYVVLSSLLLMLSWVVAMGLLVKAAMD